MHNEKQNGFENNRKGYATRREMVASKLPRLPLPELKDTCERYIKVVEPIADDVERIKEVTKKLLEEDGPSLHAELQAIDRENKKGSWLSGLWESSYLEGRHSLPINVNPLILLDKFEGSEDQVQVLAATIRSIASYFYLLSTDGIPTDTDKQGRPLCCYQNMRIFASARIPGRGRDSYKTFKGSTHIILNIGGHLFAYNVLTTQGEVISQELCEKAIKKCLKDMVEKAMTYPQGGAVPVLTTLDRDTWADAREMLETRNGDILRTIDSAIAVFHISDVDPGNPEEASSATLTNKFGWYDKLQCIALRNGQISFNMEHTAVDGHVMLAMVEYVGADMAGKNDNRIPVADDKMFAKHAKPTYLEWDMPQGLEGVLEKAQEDFEAFTSSLACSYVDFRAFGKSWIKSMNVSPDAFIQMAIQLAYYCLFHRVSSNYESVLTKRYFHGRTETGRTLTREMKEFVQVMENVAATVEDKGRALRAASIAHKAQITMCQEGKGVDRHLWALEYMAKLRQNYIAGYSIPDFFKDEAYQNLLHIILSTSTTSVKGIYSFGFGPVVPDGFGIGYVSSSDRLVVCVTSLDEKGLGSARFLSSKIEKAFVDMRTVLEACPASSL